MATLPDVSTGLISSILKRRIADDPGAFPALNKANETTPNRFAGLVAAGPGRAVAAQGANPFAGQSREQLLSQLKSGAVVPAGVEPEEENDTFFGGLMDAVDFISQNAYGIRNVQVNALRGLNGKPVQSAWQAYSSGFSMDPNKRVRSLFTDVLIEAGVPEGPSVELPILGRVTARGALGFLVDMIDPTLPSNKIRLFSRTRQGSKAYRAAIVTARDKAMKALPEGLQPRQVEDFIEKFVGDADKTTLLAKFSDDARKGHRALVSLYGVNILPTPFNVKVFEAFSKAADALGSVPLVGGLTGALRGRPIKRVINQFVSEAQAMRNFRVDEISKSMIEIERRVLKLPKAQQDAIVPALEGAIGFRRIISQGLEVGKTTDEIVLDIRKQYPKFHAEKVREGQSLLQILEDTQLSMRTNIQEMTLAELGVKGKLPKGVTPQSTYADFQALKVLTEDASERLLSVAARGVPELGPLKGHLFGDTIRIETIPTGTRKKLSGPAKLIDADPNGAGVTIQYNKNITRIAQGKKIVVKKKGDTEFISFDDAQTTLFPRTKTIKNRKVPADSPIRKVDRTAMATEEGRFKRAQDRIETNLRNNKLDHKTRIAVEIAQKRIVRKNMAREAIEMDLDSKYKPGSSDAYFADQKYFDAIKVSRETGSLDVGARGQFRLKAPDGTEIRGERLPISSEVDDIIIDLERKLDQIGIEEISRDILDDVLEVGYYPRVPMDKFKNVMDRMVPTFSRATRKRYSDFTSASGHRNVTTMTSEEFAAFNRDHKTRISDVFEANERKQLYKEMAREDPAFATFFDTEHPAIRVFQRIGRSIRAQTNADFVQNTAEFFAKESGASFKVLKATDKEVIEALVARPGHSLYVIKRKLDRAMGVAGKTDDEVISAVQRNAFDPDSGMVKVEQGSLSDIRKGGKEMNVYVLPDEVVRELESVNRVMSTPQSVKEVAKLYRNFMSLYKGFALMAPAYHARNVVSNMWTNMIAGVRPGSYANALEYTHRKRGNPLAGVIATDDGLQTMTKQDMLNVIQERNIMGVGFIGAESAESIQSQFRRPGLNPLKQNFFGLRANRKVGSMLEDHSRVAHFLDVWKKTGSIPAAQRSVNKYLFNYAKDLPTWERWATNVVPFWRWMRSNYPLQMQLAITHPGKLRLLGSAKLAMESDNKEQFPSELMPEYIKRGLGVQMRTKGDKTEFFLLKGFLATGDLDDIFKFVQGGEDTNQLQELIRTTVNSLGPFKMPIESALNHSTFFGRKLERFPGETGDFLGGRFPNKSIQYLRAVRPLNELNKLNPGNLFGDEATGRTQLSGRDRFVNFMTGGKLTPVDQVKAYNREIRERKLYAKKLRHWANELRSLPAGQRKARQPELDNLDELIRQQFEEMRNLHRPKGAAGKPIPKGLL